MLFLSRILFSLLLMTDSLFSRVKDSLQFVQFLKINFLMVEILKNNFSNK